MNALVNQFVEKPAGTVSDVYGIETAGAYRDRFGIPFVFESLPIGPTAGTALALRGGSA
jgi:nitrogenase molybdenum-iron protein alpha/beta subunit